MKNFAIITVLASAITFGLFVFMAFLISSDKVVVTTPGEEIPIVIMTLPEDKPKTVRVKNIVKPPMTPPPAPSPKVPQTSTELDSTLAYTPPAITLTNNTNTPFSLGNNGNTDARPVVRIAPKYPASAAMNGTEGWVVLGFDISAIGEVINISIIDSEPKRVFDKAAKQALRKWKYKAKSIDGKAVEQQNFTVQLDFTMGQST